MQTHSWEAIAYGKPKSPVIRGGFDFHSTQAQDNSLNDRRDVFELWQGEYHTHMHDEPSPSPFGTPGEPVPTVDAAELKSVWSTYRQVELDHPSGAVGICVELLKQVCSVGADVFAVSYRCRMIWLLEMCRADALLPWKRTGQFDEAIFRVAANIPMKRMAVGVPQSDLPFDVDAFIEQLQEKP
jgi:hypothetical protein